VSGAVIELLPEQPTAHASFAATNLILAAAEALGRLARIEAIAAGKSVEEARICGHAVAVSRLALAIDDLVTTQQALLKGGEDLARYIDEIELILKHAGYPAKAESLRTRVSAWIAIAAKVGGAAA
jgi:hypothetical protein